MRAARTTAAPSLPRTADFEVVSRDHSGCTRPRPSDSGVSTSASGEGDTDIGSEDLPRELPPPIMTQLALRECAPSDFMIGHPACQGNVLSTSYAPLQLDVAEQYTSYNLSTHFVSTPTAIWSVYYSLPHILLHEQHLSH